MFLAKHFDNFLGLRWRRSWGFLSLLVIACQALAGPTPLHHRGRLLHKASTVTSFIAGATLVAAQRVAAADRDRISTSEDFRAKFPYTTTTDFVSYLLQVVPKEGDPDSVLKAMDEFAENYPMYKITPFKASLLDRELRRTQPPPKSVLELGSFYGYSAVHLLRGTDNLCTVTCVEGNEQNVEVIRTVLAHAFGSTSDSLKRLRLVPGLSSTVISKMDATAPAFDFCFFDHDKASYLPDLRALESRNLLSPNCVIVADNVVYPGAPDYMQYVSSVDGLWQTVVEKAPFERVGFETRWQQKEDGMAISHRNKVI